MRSGRTFLRVALKVVMACALAHCIGVQSVTEQPMSSLIFTVPCFKRFISVSSSAATTTYLGAFGAPTLKPLRLIHNTTWAKELRRKKVGKQSKLFYRVGKNVYGRKRLLSASEEYPVEFGKALSSAFLNARGIH